MRDLLLLASQQLQEMNGRQVELKPVLVVESISCCANFSALKKAQKSQRFEITRIYQTSIQHHIICKLLAAEI